jgi:hypothetical protein
MRRGGIIAGDRVETAPDSHMAIVAPRGPSASAAFDWTGLCRL